MGLNFYLKCFFQVLISIPSSVVPRLSTICFWTKRSRQHRIRKRRAKLSAAIAGSVTVDDAPSAPPISPVDLEEGVPISEPLHAKLPSLDANSIEGLKQTVGNSIEPSAPVDSSEMDKAAITIDSDSIAEESDDEEEEEPEELRQGQVLWIRGLSRLQTQVYSSTFSYY